MNLPTDSARVAAWASAFLAGLVAPDDVADQSIEAGRVHRVVGASGSAGTGETPAGQPQSVTLALAEMRSRGA